MIRLYVIWYYSGLFLQCTGYMLSGIIPACFYNVQCVGLGADEQAVKTSNFQPLEVVSRGSV